VIHRAHDYAHLIRRWRTVAKRVGLRLEAVAEAGPFQVFALKTLGSGRGLYISAGIHGDEPASTEGLIAWAEKHTPALARLPLTIFPCLNPWGLTQNMRTNEAGLDLNRAFDRDDVPVTRAVREKIAGQKFAMALMLHEDFDGQGIYLYEGFREDSGWGSALLAHVSPIIGIDPRTRIDISRPKAGVVRRRFDARHHARLGGTPEAIYLHREHACHSITFETPSEFALDRRVAAHVAMIEACVERCTQLEAETQERVSSTVRRTRRAA
jgi:protein MpaA